MKKGIIMDIDEHFLILLTPEGEFLRTHNKKDRYYVIGEEISFFPILNEGIQKKKMAFFSFQKVAGLSFVIALLFAFIFLLPINNDQEVYAFMSIDINPSIEMGMNKKLEVIELKAYNEQGEAIIQQLNEWKKNNFKSVTEDIIHVSENQGYLKDKQDIVIATVISNEKNNIKEKMDNQLLLLKEKWSKEKVDLKIVHATEKERKKANNDGVSIGTYKNKEVKHKNKLNNMPMYKENKNGTNEKIVKPNKNKGIKKQEQKQPKKEIHQNKDGKIPTPKKSIQQNEQSNGNRSVITDHKEKNSENHQKKDKQERNPHYEEKKSISNNELKKRDKLEQLKSGH